MDSKKDGELLRAKYDKVHHINIHINHIVFFDMHEHDCLELVIVLRGKGRYICEQGEIPIKPGDILLRNFYDPHAMATDGAEQLSTLCLQVSANFCREYFPKLRNLRFDTAAVADLPSEDLQRIHDLAIAAAKSFFEEEPGYQLSCVGNISTLLAFLISRLPNSQTDSEELMARRSKGDRKRRLISYINQHYKEKITLESLAATECVTPTHLCHFFRENFDLSFREYLNKVRLEKALVQIQDPKIYLVDICMETGFSDSRYLNSVFEKTFGLSIAEYRRQCREKDAISLRRGPTRSSGGGRYSHAECIQLMDEHVVSGGFRY